MLKRLLAMSLCVCMIISMLCWNVSAAKEAGKEETAFNFLVDLGIASPDLESLENVMSREEFAVYMTKMSAWKSLIKVTSPQQKKIKESVL